MKPLQVALLFAYLFMAPFYFTSWLKLYNKDISLSAEERLLSRVFLVISTILWPLVVPIAYLELLNKKNMSLTKVWTQTLRFICNVAKVRECAIWAIAIV